MDRLVGGWSFDGIARIQSGTMLDFGNVRLVGMRSDELQDTFKLRFDDAGKLVYMLPQDIIDNTVKAFSVSATSATGYGDRARPRAATSRRPTGRTASRSPPATASAAPAALVVTGPTLVRFDLSAVKRMPSRAA